MNRFDKSFNGIDPATKRPFSSGHPDGVWLIAVLYLLVILVTFASAVATIISSEGSEARLKALAPALTVAMMFIPPLVLLWMRKRAALAHL